MKSFGVRLSFAEQVVELFNDGVLVVVPEDGIGESHFLFLRHLTVDPGLDSSAGGVVTDQDSGDAQFQGGGNAPDAVGWDEVAEPRFEVDGGFDKEGGVDRVVRFQGCLSLDNVAGYGRMHQGVHLGQSVRIGENLFG